MARARTTANHHRLAPSLRWLLLLLLLLIIRRRLSYTKYILLLLLCHRNIVIITLLCSPGRLNAVTTCHRVYMYIHYLY